MADKRIKLEEQLCKTCAYRAISGIMCQAHREMLEGRTICEDYHYLKPEMDFTKRDNDD